MLVPDPRFVTAIAAIDELNAADPNIMVFGDRSGPKELLHAELMTKWVRFLDPDADDAQLLAARAHHLRRWVLPRHEFPHGRAGYLRWRTELSKRHASDAADILLAAGYGDELVARVGTIIRKHGRTTDPAVQVHEDALCLVFLETQFADLAARLGHDKTLEVVVKTVAKMSPAGLAAAARIELAPQESAVLAEALAR
jgi:hypothetical protein